MKKTILLLVAIIFLCGLSGTAMAQESPGILDSLYSETMQENRLIKVLFPKNYDSLSGEKYDVLYLLDGEWHTAMASFLNSFTVEQDFMPSTIIVGIINVDRNRDFLPSVMENIPNSGGAENFLSFIKKELIPYVDKNYPTSGDNTLYGASFGGIFSLYALLNEPQLFESYIASDPSYWWDNGYMQKLASEKLKSFSGSNKSFYVGGREGGAYKEMGIYTMDSIFQAMDPKGLSWKFEVYKNETHGSVNLKTMYDGLKFSYTGYNIKNIEFHPMSGVILKDKPIKIWCFSDLSIIRYTTDGSDPNEASPKMEREILLSAPGEIKLKPITARKKHNILTSGVFKEGQALPAVSKPKKVIPGGFRYTYYEGSWDSLPDFKKLKPVKTGIADKEFDLKKLPSQNNFACLIEGYIEIQEDGYHIFGLDSDDGSRLYVGGQLLIDYDGLHGNGRARSYILPLQKGFYPLRLEFFQKEGGSNLQLIYLTPNTEEPKKIPFELQYGKL